MLQNLSSKDRRKILLDVADALEANEKIILLENEVDVSTAMNAGHTKAIVSRLTLKSEKARPQNIDCECCQMAFEYIIS